MNWHSQYFLVTCNISWKFTCPMNFCELQPIRTHSDSSKEGFWRNLSSRTIQALHANSNSNQFILINHHCFISKCTCFLCQELCPKLIKNPFVEALLQQSSVIFILCNLLVILNVQFIFALIIVMTTVH